MSEGKPSLIMQYKELILAVTALVVGTGGVLKPPDTTAVETGHKLHSAEMSQIEANQSRMRQDLANMHAFMIGYVAEQQGTSPAAEDEESEQQETSPAAEDEESEPTQDRAAPRSRRSASSLPSLSAAPRAVAPPDLREALAMEDAELAELLAEMEAGQDGVPDWVRLGQGVDAQGNPMKAPADGDEDGDEGGE